MKERSRKLFGSRKPLFPQIIDSSQQEEFEVPDEKAMKKEVFIQSQLIPVAESQPNSIIKLETQPDSQADILASPNISQHILIRGRDSESVELTSLAKRLKIN